MRVLGNPTSSPPSSGCSPVIPSRGRPQTVYLSHGSLVLGAQAITVRVSTIAVLKASFSAHHSPPPPQPPSWLRTTGAKIPYGLFPSFSTGPGSFCRLNDWYIKYNSIISSCCENYRTIGAFTSQPLLLKSSVNLLSNIELGRAIRVL